MSSIVPERDPVSLRASSKKRQSGSPGLGSEGKAVGLGRLLGALSRSGKDCMEVSTASGCLGGRGSLRSGVQGSKFLGAWRSWRRAGMAGEMLVGWVWSVVCGAVGEVGNAIGGRRYLYSSAPLCAASQTHAQQAWLISWITGKQYVYLSFHLPCSPNCFHPLCRRVRNGGTLPCRIRDWLQPIGQERYNFDAGGDIVLDRQEGHAAGRHHV